jgi:hypothetical protein
MGYKVTLVNAEEITTEKLEAFDVIMTEFAPIMFSHWQVSKRYFLILLNLENNDSAIQYT